MKPEQLNTQLGKTVFEKVVAGFQYQISRRATPQEYKQLMLKCPNLEEFSGEESPFNIGAAYGFPIAYPDAVAGLKLWD